MKGGVVVDLSLMEEMGTTWQTSLYWVQLQCDQGMDYGEQVSRRAKDTHVFRVMIRLAIVHSPEFGRTGCASKADQDE